MSKENIRFAVLGCGHIGRRHAEMITRNPESELVALIDIRPKEELNVDHFNVPFYPSLEAFLAAEVDCDVVNIATPNGCHAPQAHQCLDRGYHVVVEKPMALSTNEAEQLIHKSLQVHRHLFTVMQNRYSPPSQWLKDLVVSGVLGRIFLVQVNCFWNRDERYYKPGNWHGTKALDGGTLFTQFSHFVDLLYWIFGDITDIQGRFADFNHAHLTEFEDSGIVTFKLLSGGMGSIAYSTSVAEQNLESSLTVIAENGSVKVGGQYMDQVEVCRIKGYEMPVLPPTNPGNDYGAYKGSAANHNYVIQNVIDVLKGRNSITTNALEGMKVVSMIERIYQER